MTQGRNQDQALALAYLYDQLGSITQTKRHEKTKEEKKISRKMIGGKWAERYKHESLSRRVSSQIYFPTTLRVVEYNISGWRIVPVSRMNNNLENDDPARSRDSSLTRCRAKEEGAN